MSNIPESIIEQIKNNSPEMHHLNLSNCGLNDNDISELQELLQQNKYIDSVNLANNNITSEGCKILSLIRTLKKADLAHCPIGDEGIAALINTKIENLDVSYCGVTENGAKLLQQSLTKYTSLELIGNPAISANTLQAIRSRFVKNPSVYASPIGIDLGLNIHSLYERAFDNFQVEVFEKKPLANFPSVTESIPREKALANKLIQEHDEEIANFTTEEKEKLIIQLSQSLGVKIEIKPSLQTFLKL